MFSQHGEALSELLWRFQAAESALGVHARNIAEGGSGVFDEAASHRTHMAHRTEAHRFAVAKMRKIDGCLAELTEGQARLLAVTFTPAGRASPHLASALGVSVNGQWLSLLGLAVATGIAAKAQERAEAIGDIVVWLDTKATRDELRAVQTSTLRALEPLVEAYEVRRLARVGREREERERVSQERRAMLERDVERIRVKLWG